MKKHAWPGIAHRLADCRPLLRHIAVRLAEIAKSLFLHMRTMRNALVGIFDERTASRTKILAFFPFVLFAMAINANHLLDNLLLAPSLLLNFHKISLKISPTLLT